MHGVHLSLYALWVKTTVFKSLYFYVNNCTHLSAFKALILFHLNIIQLFEIQNAFLIIQKESKLSKTVWFSVQRVHVQSIKKSFRNFICKPIISCRVHLFLQRIYNVLTINNILQNNILQTSHLFT